MQIFALLYVKCIAYELMLFFPTGYKDMALFLAVYKSRTIKLEKAKYM